MDRKTMKQSLIKYREQIEEKPEEARKGLKDAMRFIKQIKQPNNMSTKPEDKVLEEVDEADPERLKTLLNDYLRSMN